MKWYVAKMNNVADQGLIIDEETGENIAVTYKKEHAAIIAACPEMLEALKELAGYMKSNENVRNMQGPEYGIWHRGMAAIDKAEGR